MLLAGRGSFSENGPDRNGEASILHISPQLNKQSNGSTSDGNSEAPNLRGLSKLIHNFEMNYS